MVSFGQSSGPIPPLELGTLAAKGSLFITRPTLATYIARREDLESASLELFGLVGDGRLRVEVQQHYPLREAAQAHRDLEARRTTGSTVLLT
jgi:NADPH2:quinone reductase